MASVNKKETISLKILVDTKANKVVFAESGKEFVDFLFHIMSLPLGSVIKLLNQENMVGSLGDLYKSVESLNTQYFLSNLNKDNVLNPNSSALFDVPLLSLKGCSSSTKSYYRCGRGTYCSNYISDSYATICPNCRNQMCNEVNFVGKDTTSSSNDGSNNEGYVKGLVTYMVMDNLEVKPLSTISGIALLNKFHVKDVSCLEERDVEIGLSEALKILKASLETKAVLSTVLLGEKKVIFTHDLEID